MEKRKESNPIMVQNLVELISQWSEQRNIIQGSDIKSQVLKLVSEVGELADNTLKKKDIRDDIGDAIVCLNNIALMYGSTLEECMKIAYNEIKDRKGVMLNGVFIKESDPNYQRALELVKEENDRTRD